LLENFFYSLTPVIMRNVLEPQALQRLFFMLLESIEDAFFNGGAYALRIAPENQFVFVMIKAEERSVKEELNRALSKLQLHSTQLATSYVSVYDVVYLGYIYRCDDKLRQEIFCQTVQQAMKTWELKKCAKH